MNFCSDFYKIFHAKCDATVYLLVFNCLTIFELLSFAFMDVVIHVIISNYDHNSGMLKKVKNQSFPPPLSK